MAILFVAFIFAAFIGGCALYLKKAAAGKAAAAPKGVMSRKQIGTIILATALFFLAL